MPIYLVRWPRPGAVLVRARNEEHLRNLLDEIDDPSCARWSVYNGPLWIDIDLPRRSKSASEASEVDIDAMLAEDGVRYRMNMGDTDSGCEMYENVTRWALPHIHGVLDAQADERASGDDSHQDDEERAAVRDARWRERIIDAIEADIAEMNSLVHRRRVAEARAAGPEQYVTPRELRDAVESISRRVVGQRPRSKLSLVKADDDGDE